MRTLLSKQSVPYAHIGNTELGLPFWDATNEDTCTCDGCAQARGTSLSWCTGVGAGAGCECGRLERAASVGGGDMCVVCAV